MNLEDNIIGDEGAQHLANALQFNTVRLISTYLSHVHLSHLIKTIKTLKLFNNKLGDKGKQYFIEEMKIVPSRVRLWMTTY